MFCITRFEPHVLRLMFWAEEFGLITKKKILSFASLWAAEFEQYKSPNGVTDDILGQQIGRLPAGADVVHVTVAHQVHLQDKL